MNTTPERRQFKEQRSSMLFPSRLSSENNVGGNVKVILGILAVSVAEYGANLPMGFLFRQNPSQLSEMVFSAFLSPIKYCQGLSDMF